VDMNTHPWALGGAFRSTLGIDECPI